MRGNLQTRLRKLDEGQFDALALAAAGLNHRVIAAMPDVPFMCALTRAVGLTDDPPYADIAGYLAVHRDEVEQVRRTLAYFDGALLGARATCPALFSTGLMDTTCPPSSQFAAYNKLVCEKEMIIYPDYAHETPGSHKDKTFAFLSTL